MQSNHPTPTNPTPCGSPPENPVVSAEFDEYATDYTGGMDNGLKQLVGQDEEAFIVPKVRWLLDDLVRRPVGSARPGVPLTLLDYGCGTGIFLRVLRRLNFPGALFGSEISTGMLDEARARWVGADQPEFIPQRGSLLDCGDGAFDLIVISSVLHHVEPSQRSEVYRELLRLLKPNGRLFAFEHNPRNPVTCWVVRNTPIDRNAILLDSTEVRVGLRGQGADSLYTRFLIFFPPRFRFLLGLERYLSRLPFGGQYVVTCSRTEGGMERPTSRA